MRILKIVAGVFFWIFASLWLAVQIIATAQGAIAIPSDMSSTQATLLGILQWLTGTPPVFAVLLRLGLYAFGFGLLFWHPEKGWAFYFDRTTPPLSPPVSETSVQKWPPAKSITPPVILKTSQFSDHLTNEASGKDFVNRSASELLEIFKTNTEYHAKIIFQPYVGAWIFISGNVHDIYEIGADDIMVQVKSENVGYNCQFSRNKWGKIIARLQKEDEFSGVGQISPSQSGMLLRLINCEVINLLNAHPPSQEPQ